MDEEYGGRIMRIQVSLSRARRSSVEGIIAAIHAHAKRPGVKLVGKVRLLRRGEFDLRFTVVTLSDREYREFIDALARTVGVGSYSGQLIPEQS